MSDGPGDGLSAQFRRHSVALVSLVIAMSSLAYNTWRNETTEAHRNVRYAAFRVLESLGELQSVVDYRHYYLPWIGDPDREGETRLSGYGNVAMIRDLTSLMPDPAPAAGARLAMTWQRHANELDDLDETGHHNEAARSAEQAVREALEDTRSAVLAVLASLE